MAAYPEIRWPSDRKCVAAYPEVGMAASKSGDPQIIEPGETVPLLIADTDPFEVGGPSYYRVRIPMTVTTLGGAQVEVSGTFFLDPAPPES